MRLVLWLLDRFGVAESVTGDVIERLASGKSTLWLGRQVAGAIAGAVIADVRRYPWVALRAVAIGLSMLVAVDRALRLRPISFSEWVGRAVYDYLTVSPSMIVLVMATNALVAAPGWFAIGWLVARWHRRGDVLLLLTLVLAVVLPSDVRHFLMTLSYPRPVTYRVVDVAGTATWMTSFTIALVAGALCVRTRRHDVA